MRVAWWDVKLYSHSLTHSLRAWAGDAYWHYLSAVSRHKLLLWQNSHSLLKVIDFPIFQHLESF